MNRLPRASVPVKTTLPPPLPPPTPLAPPPRKSPPAAAAAASRVPAVPCAPLPRSASVALQATLPAPTPPPLPRRAQGPAPTQSARAFALTIPDSELYDDEEPRGTVHTPPPPLAQAKPRPRAKLGWVAITASALSGVAAFALATFQTDTAVPSTPSTTIASQPAARASEDIAPTGPVAKAEAAQPTAPLGGLAAKAPASKHGNAERVTHEPSAERKKPVSTASHAKASKAPLKPHAATAKVHRAARAKH